MSTARTNDDAAPAKNSLALTIAELHSFHPDGNPVGHPGLSAGLRGYADRNNRQAFTPPAGRLPESSALAGGMLVLPQGVDPVIGEQLATRAKSLLSDRAEVRCGHFFSGKYSRASRSEGGRVSWGDSSVCLDISAVTENELADIARDLVTQAGCAAALLRHETSRRIDLVSGKESGIDDLSKTDSLLRRLFRRSNS